MSSEFLPQEEFVLAHRGSLEAIVNSIDNIMSSNTVETIRVFSNDYEAEFISGQQTAEELKEAREVYNPSFSNKDAQELAELENQATLLKARTTVRFFVGLATVKKVTSIVDEMEQKGGYSDQEIIDYAQTAVPDLLDYKVGLIQSAFFRLNDGSTVELSHTKLEGLEYYGQADSYDITLSDGLVDKNLRLSSIAGRFEGVSLSVNPSDSPLFERAYKVMGIEGIADLIPLLAGRFDSEEELDKALSAMWLKCVGKSTEEEASPLLDELRNQVISQKELSSFSLQHQLDVPSADELEFYQELLAYL